MEDEEHAMNDIMVSILCTAYNHERYINRCLEGFLIQKTTFSYEVLINDDASTDNTRRIIEEYSLEYPNIIKPVYQEENQFSKGIMINRDILFPLARGKYIALCEGDDYWVDPYKLQRQVEALENNPECNMCLCRVRVVKENGTVTRQLMPCNKIDTGILSSDEFLKTEVYNTFQTSGFVMRKTALSYYYTKKPRFQQICNVGDIPLRLYFGSIGSIYYISDILSCYRIGSVSSISKQLEADKNKKIIAHLNMIETVKEFDEFTNYRYKDSSSKRILKNEFGILVDSGEYLKALSPIYREPFMHRSKKRRIQIVIMAAYEKLRDLLCSI